MGPSEYYHSVAFEANIFQVKENRSVTAAVLGKYPFDYFSV
jgi:hypothetical protein